MVYREAGYTGKFIVSFFPFDLFLEEMYGLNSYNRGKCTKYETCATLHRFHILYLSCDCYNKKNHVFTVQRQYVLFNVTFSNRATFNQTSFQRVFTVYREAGYTGTLIVSVLPFDLIFSEIYN